MRGAAALGSVASPVRRNSSPPTTKRLSSAGRLTRTTSASWSPTTREAESTGSSRNLRGRNGESGSTASETILANFVSRNSIGLRKIRPLIRRWRNHWADTPRTADYALQVLSRVAAHAVELGRIAGNPCEGIKHLYKNDRSEIIWTDADVTHIKRTCSAEVANAVDLACHTGLRLSDLIRVAWSHVGDDAIVLTTGKSSHRREAIIPLHSALHDVLGRIPKLATTILTSSRRRPWTADGFGSSVNKAKIDAGMSERDLHFNDLRGTAAAKFYIAGFSMREIAETLAWEEESVEKIIRRYVGRAAAIKARITKLEIRK
jgi:integrase